MHCLRLGPYVGSKGLGFNKVWPFLELSIINTSSSSSSTPPTLLSSSQLPRFYTFHNASQHTPCSPALYSSRHWYAAFFALCTSLHPAVISIINPTANTIWYANDTVSLNWTLSDPTADTYLFRTYLSNQDQSLLAGNTSIADSSKSAG